MFNHRTFYSVAFGLVLVSCCRAYADSPVTWTLTTGDLRTQSIAGLSVDENGVHAAGAAAGWDRFVSVQRDDATPTPAGTFLLQLDGRERLVGSPAGTTGDALLWQEPTLGTVTIPLNRLRSLTRIGAAATNAAAATAAKQDVVNLSNGDSVSGVFTGCTAGTLTVQTDAGNTDVPLLSVEKVTFAVTTLPPQRPAAGHALRVRLVDGTAFTADHATLQDRAAALQLPGRPAAVTVPVDQIAGFEAVNGPVLWLADQVPTGTTAVPYFGPLDGEATPARTLIAADDSDALPRAAEHRISVRPLSRLQYRMPAGVSAFQTQFAIATAEGSSNPWADVTVRIRVDDRVAFEQPHVRAGPASPVVTISLAGAKQIILECDFGDGQGVQGALDWIEPALLR